jgi:DUF971 family protein
MDLVPIAISRPKPFLLKAEWVDGFSAIISCEQFRRECPCAQCTGERINDVIYSKPKPIRFMPGIFELKSLNVNGHNTVIYTWYKFRKIFEKFKLNDEEIEKLEKTASNDKRDIKFNIVQKDFQKN